MKSRSNLQPGDVILYNLKNADNTFLILSVTMDTEHYSLIEELNLFDGRVYSYVIRVDSLLDSDTVEILRCSAQ